MFKQNIMILRMLIIVVVSTLLSCKSEIKNVSAVNESKSNEISFYTSDSIKIFGDLFEIDKDSSAILLFHQGGSNARGEYGPIIPRLRLMGYNILSIDQRMGGQSYGNYNRTLANIPTNSYGDGYGYCDAYNNLESALDFIINAGFKGSKILWGSSYSASLAIQLASKKQDVIDGVLAFSPASGGSMKDCKPDQYFETIQIPLILLRPPNEMESEGSKAQFELAKKLNHETFIARFGTHGSSMLVRQRVGNDVDASWEVVESFLNRI